MHYWCSWSAGIGFWKKDIERIDSIDLNPMFPNASLLFDVRNCSDFIIWNKKYQNMSDDSGKGGYGLFKTFAVDFLDILSKLRLEERISLKKFIDVKKQLKDFIAELYLTEVILPTSHTYIIKDIRQSIMVYYDNL